MVDAPGSGTSSFNLPALDEMMRDARMRGVDRTNHVFPVIETFIDSLLPWPSFLFRVVATL